MTRQIKLLVGMVFGCWCLSACLALLVWGTPALVVSALAAVLCLIPCAGTLIWANWAVERSPLSQFAMVLGGTGARMFFVLGGGLALNLLFPSLRQLSFWIWVLFFYLLTLASEMTLLVSGRPASVATRQSLDAECAAPRSDITFKNE